MRSPVPQMPAKSLGSSTSTRDFVAGTAESTVEWHLLNMADELVTARLGETIGPGLRQVLRPHWTYHPGRGDGITPIPHLVSLETYGHKIAIGAPLRSEYRIRLVTLRKPNRALVRAHLVMNCELFHRDPQDRDLLGRSEIWMALTRPFAPPERRRPTAVPPGLTFLTEHPLTEADLGSRPIESFRCEAPAAGTLTHDTLPLVYHMDRSDYNRHTNMHVYPQQAQDYLALAYHRVGGDAGRLRFRGMTIYFRRPFLPGEVADVDIDLAEEGDRFEGALRFYHATGHASGEGRHSERISMALHTRGILTPADAEAGAG